MLTAPGGGTKGSIIVGIPMIIFLSTFGLVTGCLGPSASGSRTGSSTDRSTALAHGTTSGSGDSIGSNGAGANGADGSPGADGNPGADGTAGADGFSSSGTSSSGTVTGSADTTSRVIPLPGVTSIVVGANFVVHLTQGEPEQATVRVNGNLVDLIDATVTGNQLRLGLKPGANISNATLSAEITVAHLDSLDTSGASQVTGSIETDHLTVTGSGASTLTLSGRVQDLQLSGSGTSHWLLSDLTIRDLTAILSGASNATVTVTGTLAGQADDASTLRYRGTPTITRQQASSGASIAPDSP